MAYKNWYIVLLMFFPYFNLALAAADSPKKEILLFPKNQTDANDFILKIKDLMRDELSNRGVDIVPGADYENPALEATLIPFGDHHVLYITKGLIAALNGSTAALAQVVAHEIGHALGFRNWENARPIETTIEGEADYYANKKFLKRVVQYYDIKSGTPADLIESAKKSLKSAGVSSAEISDYATILAGAMISLTANNLKKEKNASLFRRDNSEVIETNYDYPSPQSRLDTARAGLLNLPRPKSWALPVDFAATNRCNKIQY